MANDQLEGRNPVIEALARKRRAVKQIWMDRGAKEDDRIRKLLKLAEVEGVPLAKVSRNKLDEMSEGRVHQGVIAHAEPLPMSTSAEMVSNAFDQEGHPFFILADQIQYEHNLGAILRSALGFGVSGLILPTRRGASLTPVVQRVAMGAAEAVPVVNEGLFSAIKHMKKAGIPVVGADMNGTPLTEARLSGPLAFVMGGEGRGLSPTLRKHCDHIVSIPLAGQLESLNVSVAAALLMYEKRRQDGWFNQK
ncbi:MAG: 23S rRNA (guanosine2251-2'-O)-methyltransferase [Myxococcota bacterium]|jgi:23S rRNA (guanosine2251-2'-O)-methyltransferase